MESTHITNYISNVKIDEMKANSQWFVWDRGALCTEMDVQQNGFENPEHQLNMGGHLGWQTDSCSLLVYL